MNPAGPAFRSERCPCGRRWEHCPRRNEFELGPARAARAGQAPCGRWRSLKRPRPALGYLWAIVAALAASPGRGLTMLTRFEEILAVLLARDNMYPSDPELKNMVKAEFLRGAAMAFALCWRGEESVQCLAAAQALHDQTNAA
jgi:hypothetical protein